MKKEVLDRRIDEEIKKAEKEIEVLKKNAPEKINKIAIETSSELIKKLIGAEINNSSISAIVDDLSNSNEKVLKNSSTSRSLNFSYFYFFFIKKN